MRRWAMAVVLAVAVALPDAAGADPFHSGVRAGVVFANIHGDFEDVANPDSKLGFDGGGFFEVMPGPIGIALEANYVQKGFSVSGQQSDDEGNPLGIVESNMNLSYLEIPVLLRLSMPGGGAITPYLSVGPTLGIALGATFENEGTGLPDIDFGDDLEKLDLGGLVGVGARFGTGPVRFGIEARYSTGFNDLWDIEGNLESINHTFGVALSLVR